MRSAGRVSLSVNSAAPLSVPSAPVAVEFVKDGTFVASAHRHTNVARHLISSNRDLLERRFVSGGDTKAQGMIFELKHEGMRRHLNTALWATSRFVFIGENQRGWHVRVYYFPGARVPLPGPLPAS